MPSAASSKLACGVGVRQVVAADEPSVAAVLAAGAQSMRREAAAVMLTS